MAAPILAPNGQRSVYLPDDVWYPFGSGARLQGGRTIDVAVKLDEIPVYLRAGTILPLGPVVQNTDRLPGGPLEVQVYPGRNATFTLVEDDGETMDYLKGAVRRTTFTWDERARRLSWKTDGAFKGARQFHDLKIVVFDPAAGGEPKPVTGSMDGGGSVVVSVPY